VAGLNPYDSRNSGVEILILTVILCIFLLIYGGPAKPK
jgi:hypothetical protein